MLLIFQTRIAAAQAVEAILQNVPQWKPQPSTVKTELESNRNYESSRLTFGQFDLKAVLEKGAHLIGSEGTEFDVHDEMSTGEDSNGSGEKDRLIRQRMLLNEKLGLNQSSQLGILNINDLVTLDDMRNPNKKNEPNKTLMPVQEVLNLDVTTGCGNNTAANAQTGSTVSLSCREMNRAKRKARQYQSQTSTISNSGNSSSGNQTAATGLVSTNSATFSRSNSLSNGSLSDEQPETKKRITDAEFVHSSNGKCFNK